MCFPDSNSGSVAQVGTHNRRLDQVAGISIPCTDAGGSPMFSWVNLPLTQGEIYQVNNCQVLGSRVRKAEKPRA